MPQNELYQRGAQALKAGNYDEARRLFREHEEKAGTAIETLGLVQQADAKLQAGDVDAATALYARALDRNPSLTEVYLGLARTALFTGQLEAAKVHATAATRLGPRVGLAWTLMGLVHETSGDTAGALEHLRMGAELSPGEFLCQYNLGRVLASAGRAPEAIIALATATGLDPTNPDGFSALGLAYKAARQHENALRSLERAKDLAPKNVNAWAALADALFEVREFKAARDILDRALVACGDHPVLLEKALATAMLQGDADAAVAYVERELEIAPYHEQAWLNLAGLSLLTREFDKSEAAAKKLLAKNPENWEAWFLLGNLYDALLREREAEEAWRKAIELSPGNWKPVMNLATLFVQSTSARRHAEAVPLLEKAVSLAPKGEWRVHYNLALAFTRLGQKERGLELARRIQTEAPPGDAIVAAARKLESNLLEAHG